MVLIITHTLQEPLPPAQHNTTGKTHSPQHFPVEGTKRLKHVAIVQTWEGRYERDWFLSLLPQSGKVI